MSIQSPGKIYLRLLGYLHPWWKRLVVLLLCTIVFASLSGVTLTLIPPFLHILFGSQVGVEGGGGESGGGSLLVPDSVEQRIDSVTRRARDFIYEGTQTERLARFCLILILLMAVKNVFEYVSTYQTIFLEQSMLKRIRDELYGKIQLLPLSFFDTQRTGHLISRITNDVTNLRGAVVGSLASIIRNGLMAIIAVTIVFYTSWRLSLLTIVIVPINVALIAIISRKLRKGSMRAQERMADMTSVLQETISGVRVVKAFGMERFEQRKFGSFNLRYFREYLKMRRFAELASPTSELLGMTASVIILWYGGRLVISQQLDPADLMMFIGAMLWVVTPIKHLSKLNAVVQEGLASAQRVFEILDVDTEEDTSGEYEIGSFEREIVYEGVHFSYKSGMPVLEDIDLRIGRGEVVALVGSSGAGKTTVADLLPRFYRPTAGRILIDGRDIASISLQSLRALMGIVTQETILFNDSVFNNIAYGMDDCPREDVVRAAAAANARQFIEAMPDKYDTVIGDRGVQLSGGQRQRIAIARALLKDPQILILDEATSSLDAESEALVQGAIDRLVEGRTTLVIAHRLSTIKKADRIVVLEEGRIRQIGTHEELIGEEGIYRRLYSLQIRA
ncbi:MAG: ABC transporter transmembrane domain-containing protein [Candidatus Krumholzibacteria bacterium]|nr:ABC transporter transmembrane domain-containing protein [Candidatus Krumholzibacteria bacterium]